MVLERNPEFVAGSDGFCFLAEEPLHSGELLGLCIGQRPQQLCFIRLPANRRFSIYVPEQLAPEIQEAIKKGRRLEDLIKEAGVRYLRAQKRERRSTLLK